ncbi:MAG: hypothetical protein JW748_08325 [Anaerolineales bacterium]|nr:hypothetical protein [Anaerolineales bacterium]
MRVQQRWMIGWIVLAGAFTVSCAKAQAPTRVASYPLPSSGGISSGGIADGLIVVETVYLTLEVGDPDGAAEKAAGLAYGYGGYEADRYAWQVMDGRTVSQEIFVPIDRSDDLHTRLLQMGRKDRDSLVRHSSGWYGPGEGWAQFSIQYRTGPPEIEWDPSGMEDFLNSVWRFFEGAAAFLMKIVAALLLAAAVVIPCLMMIVGIVTTVRWLLRR